MDASIRACLPQTAGEWAGVVGATLLGWAIAILWGVL